MNTKDSLYRQEAIDHQTAEKLGDVLILPKRLHLLISIVLMSLFCLGVLMLATRTYVNKVKVSGWIISQEQVATVNHFEPSGELVSVLIKNGDIVAKNQPLMRVRRAQALLQGSALHTKREESIRARIKAQNDANQHQRTKAIADTDFQNARKKHLQTHLNLLTLSQSTLNKQIDKFTKQLSNYRSLKTQLFISQQSVDDLIQSIDELSMRERQIQLDINSTKRESDLATHQIRDIEFIQQRYERDHAEQIRALNIELHTLNQSNEYTIFAPRSGIISGLQVQKGSDLSKQKTLLKIVSAHQHYQAKLFIPASAIGLIKPKQVVSMRLDAFPYQQFGAITGRLTHVGQTILMPDEIASTPTLQQQALFEAEVQLTSNAMEVEGKQIKFKHGMSFEASVQLEDRNIIEWLLAPIYRLKGAL